MKSPQTVITTIKDYYKNDKDFKRSVVKLAHKLGLEENVILRKLAIASIIAASA